MGVIKALKTSWNTNLNKIEKKVIAKMEEHTQKPLTPKQMKKAHKKAKKILYRRIRKRITHSIALSFGIVGITAGAAGLLNEAQSPEPKTGIESDNNKETKKNKFFQELQEYEKGSENDPNNITNLMFNEYTNNLQEQGQSPITKDDMSVIEQTNMGEAHVIKMTIGEGEDAREVYIEDPLKKGTLPEEQEWVEAKDIDKIMVFVDTKNKNIIGGLGEINDAYSEVVVVNTRYGNDEYTMNESTYAGLPEGIDIQKAFEESERYSQYKEISKKLEESTANQEKIEETEQEKDEER